jgi:hypothetical protein
MSILSHTHSPVSIVFTHEPWCETEFHQLPPEEVGAEELEPCLSPVLLDTDGAVVYARSTQGGPVVVLNTPPAGSAMTVTDFEQFCRDGLRAAASLRVPAPRTDSGHVRIGHLLATLGLLGAAAFVPAASAWPPVAVAGGVAAIVGVTFLVVLFALACRGVRTDRRRTAANLAAHARLNQLADRSPAADVRGVTVTVTVLDEFRLALTAVAS